MAETHATFEATLLNFAYICVSKEVQTSFSNHINFCSMSRLLPRQTIEFRLTQLSHLMLGQLSTPKLIRLLT